MLRTSAERDLGTYGPSRRDGDKKTVAHAAYLYLFCLTFALKQAESLVNLSSYLCDPSPTLTPAFSKTLNPNWGGKY